MPDPLSLIIYSRPGCHLCDEMKALVTRIVGETGTATSLHEIDVETDPELERRFGAEVPVLFVNGTKVAKYRVSEAELRRILRAGRAGRAG